MMKSESPHDTMSLVMKLRTAAINKGPMSVSLRQLLQDAADDLESHEQSFDLRWNADMRAIKRWQAEKPGRNLTWPDHADLCVWLLEEHERITAALNVAMQLANDSKDEPR